MSCPPCNHNCAQGDSCPPSMAAAPAQVDFLGLLFWLLRIVSGVALIAVAATVAATFWALFLAALLFLGLRAALCGLWRLLHGDCMTAYEHDASVQHSQQPGAAIAATWRAEESNAMQRLPRRRARRVVAALGPAALEFIACYRITLLQRARRAAASMFKRFTTWRT